MDNQYIAFECVRCKQVNVFPENKGEGNKCMYCNGHIIPMGTIKVYEKQQNKKPPLGIEPKSIWMGKRKIKLREAIQRYLDAEMYIPVEWIEEWNKR